MTVQFGKISIVSCYISPNVPRGVFLEFIDEINDVFQALHGGVLICGDFNSKSTLWEARYTNERGVTVVDWTSENDLRLLNAGTIPTCVRAQGTFIVDLSWVTPDLVQHVTNWKVLDMITLSDHAYIDLVPQTGFRVPSRGTASSKFPK